MLQFITQPEIKYSIAEQCQMVIEGSCGWIQLHTSDIPEEHLQEVTTQIAELCREAGIILVIEDNVDIAKKVGLHGVHITLHSGLSAHKIRPDFGPEMIIGIEVTDPQSILSLQDADIDYITLPKFLEDSRRKEIVDVAAMSGNILPVVFAGDYTSENVAKTLSDGASGVSTGHFINVVDNPVEYTSEMIRNLLTHE